ncbi:MAG TPA: hypothetical protein VFJ02_03045 [Vicinamibacterales bacterium]|nr:hypothetical protein [Vicinamibacterales bacterium]
MLTDTIGAIVWAVAAVGVTVIFVRLRRRRRGIGPGAGGAIYDMLNEDKRKAIEIIAEERAEARDPETRDGNLPDLER